MGLFILSCVIWLVYTTCLVQGTTTIIVGAGMSGIMAAKTLSEKGVKDFLILEATDRIGGRMHKTTVGGYTIELGANWVEGVGGKHVNPIWTLAQKYKMRTFYTDWSVVSNNTYRQEGGMYPQSEIEPPYELASICSDFSANLSERLKENGGDDISILGAQRLFGNVPKTPLEMAIDFFFYDYETAEPPRITSLKNVEPTQTFEYFGDDNYFVADSRGYEYIVQKLAQDFLSSKNGVISDDRLKLNKVVRSIVHNDKGVRVLTEDGSVYNAHNTIVSVSAGVLQTKLIQFKPKLPVAKRMAINKWDMAVYCKIFMKFPKTFWPSGSGTEFFLYAHERRGYYPLWQHLETQYPGGNLLMVTVQDEEARRIEQQPEKETKAEIMEVLRNMFGNDIPEMEAMVIPKWTTDRFYKGTFSNWPIGFSVQDFFHMKAPVGRVYFSGEHTSREFNGYVHGAYLAGIETATTVVKCMKTGDCTVHNSTLENRKLLDVQMDSSSRWKTNKNKIGGSRARRKAPFWRKSKQ